MPGTQEQTVDTVDSDANRRAAAVELMKELDSDKTTDERKLEIVVALAKINLGAFVHVAKIHLRGVIYPVKQ